MTEKKINYEFKILYVIGILLVISGHYGSYLLSVRKLFLYDTFHMPLFLFASGYFFKQKNANSIQSVCIHIKKKIFRLVIPYYLWNIVYCIVGYFLNQYTILTIESGITSPISFFTEPFLKGVGSGYNRAAWFLIALFLVETIYTFFRYFTKKIKLDNEYIIICFLFFIAVSSVCLSKVGWCNTINTMIIRTGYLLFWYGFGFFYKGIIESYTRKINNWIVLLIVLGIAVILKIFFEDEQNVKSIIFEAQFSPSVLHVFIRAAIGIIFWLRISYIITPYIKGNKFVLYIADHTFSLMMHQGMAGLLINSIIREITPSRIDDTLYTTEIWYHFSSGRNIYRFCYVILIPIIILIIVYIYELCKKELLKQFNNVKMNEGR